MANGIKGITIEFKGDTTQLGKALNSVNKEIRATDSALREVNKALELDPTNTELLAQQEALLAKQVEQVADKLELQQQAAEEAAKALEEGTISQEEYAKLAAQVAQTGAKLEELEDSAQAGADGLEEVADSADDATDSAEESSSAFEGWGEAVKASAKAAAIALAAVVTAVTAIGAALVTASFDTATLADEINTLSSVTGLSTDTIQELNYASELLDVSTETVTGAMTKLLRSMSSAQDGTGATAEAFAAMGIEITDSAGNLRDNEDVFWEVIDYLGTIENESERDAAAMELLGRSARELNPLIEAGSDAFADLAQEAHDTGYVMDNETLDAFGNLDDNMQRLRNGATTARNAIGQILLPVLTQLSGDGVGLLNDFSAALSETDGDIDAVGDVISEFVPRAIELVEQYLPMVLEVGGSIVGALVNALLDNLDTILLTAGTLLMTLCQGIIDHLDELGPVIATLTVNLVSFVTENLPTVIQAGISILLAVINGITEALPELIPVAVDAVIQICEALTDPDTLVLLVDAALQLMIALSEGLIDAIPDLLEAVPEIGANLIEALAELGPDLMSQASEWGADMIEGFVNAIRSGLTNVADAASTVASTIASYLHFSVPDIGPLSDFDESGSDMIKTFIDSMNSEDAALQQALIQQGNLIYNGMTQDYSGQLSGIVSQLSAMGGKGGPYVFNVYIGQQRFATQVLESINEENYLGGGY
ncbi:MAG: hypothetical protein IKU36_06195 [Bacteroidales bacterium]|nr:hypothetical protein [Bacteroidales bacterium]